MNAAGNLITFLSASVPSRRQCRSQQHFLLILQVAQKMSNSPPEGLTRALTLTSFTRVTKHYLGILKGHWFFPSTSNSMSVPFTLLTRLCHTPRAESRHKLSAHLPTPPQTQIFSPRGDPPYPLPAPLPFLGVFGNHHSLGCTDGKKHQGMEVRKFPFSSDHELCSRERETTALRTRY